MSTPEQWTAVDRYLEGQLLPDDPDLARALASTTAAGLPQIQVSPMHGRMLYLFARLLGAFRILEIGTLAGYSTLCMAKALPEGGRVVTLEFDPEHAKVARANFKAAGLAQRIDLRLGRAADTLPVLAAESPAPFDLFFIDADKESNVLYLDWALKLSRPGSLIVVDNVVRDGRVADPACDDAMVQGVRAMFEHVALQPRLEATAVQTVGDKGYDGFALLRVRS